MAFIQTSDQSGAGIAAAAGLARGGGRVRGGVARGGVGWVARGGRVEGSLIRSHLPLIKEGGGEGGHGRGLVVVLPLLIRIATGTLPRL
jgi:hypothetical protein